MTSPCCGFSLAVSGMMMPPALFSSASIRLTTKRSWSGRNFISVLLSSSVVLILRGGRKCPLPRRANNKRLHSWNKRARNVFCPSRMTARRRLLGDTRLSRTYFSGKDNDLGCPNQGVLSMCDYSLHHVASRPARVGDKLVTTQFNNSITRGFAAVGEPNVAVCLLPGTEVAFEKEIEFERGF